MVMVMVPPPKVVCRKPRASRGRSTWLTRLHRSSRRAPVQSQRYRVRGGMAWHRCSIVDCTVNANDYNTIVDKAYRQSHPILLYRGVFILDWDWDWDHWDRDWVPRAVRSLTRWRWSVTVTGMHDRVTVQFVDHGLPIHGSFT